MYEVGIDEDISGDADVVGFSFGKFLKGVGKGIGKGVSSVAKAAKGVANSGIGKIGIGVLAVAFPAVGVPAAAAIATANAALKKVDQGKALASDVNKNLAKLKAAAKRGDPKAAHAVNAMQVALALRKAKESGKAPVLKVVAKKGAPPNLSTSAKPAARAAAPTSLYSPTVDPSALALQLAGGGSTIGKKTLAAVSAGQTVEVPNGVAVVPGKAPVHGRRVWVGNPPPGVEVTRLNGAHAVTKSGLVLSGQTVFVQA